MLRQPVRPNPARQPLARFTTLPAPVAGLNFRDAENALGPTDALILDNYFPRPTDVVLRGGYKSHATGMTDPVETLMEYASSTGRKLWAVSNKKIYDVSSSGAVGAAAVSSLTNSLFQHVQFSTTGGDYLVCVNGADGVRTYDASAWATQTITGVTASTLKNVMSHKSRLWFVSNTTKAWYLGTGSISGAATSLDLGAVWRLGGTLQLIVPISFDSAGTGLDDVLCFVSSEGEIAAYTGTDPSSATTWSLAGLYRIGRPIGNRCFTRFAGDCIIMTEQGVVSLKQIVGLDLSQATRATITDRVNRELVAQRARKPDDTRWQLLTYPGGTMLILNAPDSDGVYQWVMNTLTGAWCRFHSQEAYCWSLLDGKPYFGASGGIVYQADTGTGDAGDAIQGDIKMGFSALGVSGIKRATLIRPNLEANGDPAPSVFVDVDYSNVTPSDVTTSATSDAVWDTAKWDQSVWAGSEYKIRPWIVSGSVGLVMAPRLRTNTLGFNVKLYGWDVAFEPQTVPTL